MASFNRRQSVALDFLDIIAQGLLRALDTESGDDNGFHLIVFSGELDLELSLVTDRDLDLLVAGWTILRGPHLPSRSSG